MRPETVQCEMCQSDVSVSRTGPLPRFCPPCRKVRSLQENRARKYTYPEGHQAKTQREWHAKNPGKRAEYRRRQRFNLEPEQYEAMLTQQGGVCGICNEAPRGQRGFHVDHDHNTGKVRGILCHHCNIGIGCFQDNPATLELAMLYILASKDA